MSFTVSPGAKVRLVPFTTYCFPASAVPPVTPYSTVTGFPLGAESATGIRTELVFSSPRELAVQERHRRLGAVCTMVRVWTGLSPRTAFFGFFRASSRVLSSS